VLLPGESNSPTRRVLGRIASKLTGVNWNLALLEFMRETGLRLESIDSVNMASVSTVVVCRRA
jgi:GTP1/Obg family GTP-binding protein